ncbi:hypothetical protein F907_01116 [Acinetobacter colistiniresistens]|uniref:Uncharacterized protein n=1 Tax=Acinetobacter colistiniresistens TaxID=280145 RepID=S3TAH1_9GAMM|nr:hypothetical protein [Acinetobacter colistiniresistens]EPG38531.1 hypothetical protein F907_01116 [Acinetobacter colistiniresistens]TVT77112.1 hypothetical protein FPV60_19525 [Acinetobacter colistiniresistens]
MRYLSQLILLFSSIFFINNVSASEYTGKIEAIVVRDSDGLVYIYLSGNRSSDIPDCAKNTSYMMIKNENSPTGRRQLAMLMMAQATNKTVSVTGTNKCTRWPDGEDIEAIILRNHK